MLKKGFSPVALISGFTITIVVITVLFLFRKNFSPNPPIVSPPDTNIVRNQKIETSSWIDLNRAGGSYSLKHPSDWIVQEAVPDFPTTLELLATDKSVLRIEVQDAAGKSLTEFLKWSDTISETAYEGQPSKTILSEEEIKIGDQNAIKRKENWNAAGFETWVGYVLSGKNIYIFSALPYNDSASLDKAEVAKNFDAVLSTVTFAKIPSTIPKDPQSFQVTKPSSWNAVDLISVDILTCLPPAWKPDPKQSSRIYFDRDSAYQPTVATLGRLPYYNGSRRQEYLKLKTQYENIPQELIAKTTVKELTINSRSVLDISIPSFPEALVFASYGNLIEIQLGAWNMVNSSEVAYRQDVYTMISCIK